MRRHSAWGLFVAAIVPSITPAAEQYFDSAGVKIAYLDEGRGEPVVLLHGFSLSAAEMWTRLPFAPTPIIPAVANEHRVIAPDFRGHGLSDKPHDPAMYGSELAEDVVRLLDHLGVAKAHVVGYSMGASVAGKLLALHPQRLLSVTFGGGGPMLRTTPALSEAMNATAESLERGDGFGPLLVALSPEGQPKPTLAQAAMMSKLTLWGKDQRALAAAVRGQSSLEVTENELAACDVPVLFVYGSREAAFKVQFIAAAQTAFPSAEVAVIQDCDHMTTVGSPEFLEAVLRFTRAHSATVVPVATEASH
jgi:pimeloyl-ACP methyl ester carboxylesterase